MNYVHHNNKAPYGETHTIITEDASAYVMITIFSESEHIAAIHDLAVLKERRGEGLGSAILEEAILEAERMGAKVEIANTMYANIFFITKGFYWCPGKESPSPGLAKTETD